MCTKGALFVDIIEYVFCNLTQCINLLTIASINVNKVLIDLVTCKLHV